jgi:hypothetical protein
MDGILKLKVHPGHLALFMDRKCAEQQQVHNVESVIKAEGSKGLGQVRESSKGQS